VVGATKPPTRSARKLPYQLEVPDIAYLFVAGRRELRVIGLQRFRPDLRLCPLELLCPAPFPQYAKKGSMNVLKPITPSEAKAVWNSISNPSARRVARALSQAGRPIHHSTVARWRLEGWRPVASGPHPLEAARQALDVAAGVLTGDPVAGVETIARQTSSEKLESLTDHQLLSRAARKVCITNRLVYRALGRHLPELLAEKMKETAALMQPLADGLTAARSAFSRAINM
jgi:hypothetical protein